MYVLHISGTIHKFRIGNKCLNKALTLYNRNLFRDSELLSYIAEFLFSSKMAQIEIGKGQTL